VHFWSLSVEEQFYLVWPVVIAVALAFAGARWWRGAREKRVLGAVLLLLVVLSFAYCVVQTYVDAPIAYYSTFARAWEFGAGGLLALAPPLSRLRAGARGLMSWIGVALIVPPVVTWTDPAPFPGWVAAIPVVGTFAVIRAGTPDVRWGTAWLAKLRPVQWVGDASYSLYLWHWPIIAFFPYITGVPSPWYVVLLLVAVGFAVAGLSLKYLENPIRFRSPRFLRHRGLIGAGLTALALLTLGVSVTKSLEAP
jgi:peptidoglycan/LPS O-acetylase OafA/YrhL